MHHDPDLVSPLYEKWFPHLSYEEKVQATADLRGFLKVLYDIYCRMERDGTLDRLGAEEVAEVRAKLYMSCFQARDADQVD